jgi:hypothetical protein
MNSTSLTNSKHNSYCFNAFLTELIENFLSEGLFILGFLVNLICVLVFAKVIKINYSNGNNGNTNSNKGYFFNYLLVKSIVDDIGFLCAVFAPAQTCTNCYSRTSLPVQIWYKYFDHYLVSMCHFCSIFFEIFASFDCYILIKQKHLFFLKKRFFLINNLVVIVFTLLLYIPKHFSYAIIILTDNRSNITIYKTVKTSYYFTDSYKAFSFISILLTDCAGVCLLVLINILLFKEFRKITKFKQRLKNRSAVIASLKAKERKLKIVFYSALNYVLLHTPNLIFSVYGKFKKTNFWLCYSSLTTFMVFLSYLTPFFIYLKYNKVFRRTFYKCFGIIFCKTNENRRIKPAKTEIITLEN